MADDLARIRDALGRRYILEREIGRGGMATVYLAMDRKHRRKVAIKVLAPEIGSALGPDRFLREIEVASQLTHPHILALHDSGQANGLLYYVMPYIEGESLRERLRREPKLPQDAAVRIATEVADALSYAHERGVIHRDVKPENILLTQGHAILADFGIARAVTKARTEALTDTGLPIGTATYMSPEQATGSKDVDGRSDIYSLGSVLYEMLAGEPPRFGSTPPAGVPAWLGQVLGKALAPSPADRFESAQAFARALGERNRWEAGASQNRLRRARRIQIAVAVAGMVVIAALTALAVRRPAASPVLDPERVLVTVLANESGDPHLDRLGDLTTDHLFRSLGATGLVRVMAVRNELEGGQSLSEVGPPRELARRLGAGTLLGGRYYREGDSLFFETQVVDVRSGEARCAIARAVAPANDVARGVALAGQRVMACLATLFDPRFAQYEAATPPPSYEAYQELLVGDELFGQSCDDCQWRGIEHVERAIGIDSTYAVAWTTLAAMSVLMGDCGRAEEIARRLDPVHDRLPPYDRAQLDASMAACRADWEAGLEAERKAMEAEPRRAGQTRWLPLFALLVNRPREALATLGTMEPARAHRGAVNYWWLVAASYHLLGEHERELEAAERARRFAPDDMFALQTEVVALAALGRLPELEERLEERLDHRADQPYPADRPGALIVRAGLELRAHGHPREGEAQLRRAVEWYRAHRPATPDPRYRWEFGRALYVASRWDEARAEFEEIIAQDPEDIHARGALGTLAARSGDRREAMRVEAWLASRWEKTAPSAERASLTYERASIAALLGEHERALSLLRQALDEGFAYVIEYYSPWLEVDPDLDPLRRDPAFQRLIRPKG